MVWVIVCGVSPEGREESMVGRTCETGVLKPRLKQRLMDDNSSELECGPMPNLMVALPNRGGALCSTPQSLADAHY